MTALRAGTPRNNVVCFMNTALSEAQLIKKYDVPVPRYTSYPTVPGWDNESFSLDEWKNSVVKVFQETNESKGISLYVHLPFCESLCTYCACNTRITKNHKVEEGYIMAVLKEWESYKQLFDSEPIIRELHLGGGTPTFFSPENLRILITGLLKDTHVADNHEFSFEGHPNNTTSEHLQTLFDLGFSRVSFGVQDLDEKVQRTINRIQPFGNLQKATQAARAIGYNSISFDLIYGLPFQTPSTIINTFEKVLALRPERVSFYSYAHVPWMRPGQRGYEDADLPSDVMKRLLYETGRSMLKSEGYYDIGMDHFALPDDSMYTAFCTGKLHRNFMGYTTNETDLLIGLGTSAISDAKYAYAQNIKKVEAYKSAVLSSSLAVVKGHVQTQEDLQLKKCILEIACQGRISTTNIVPVINNVITRDLATYCSEGILCPDNEGYFVTETGRPFVRNICSTFDLRRKLLQTAATSLFSKSI